MVVILYYIIFTLLLILYVILFFLKGIPANEWKFGVTIASSIIAAVLSSLASQPGDTLLSVVNKKARVRATVDGATSSISTSGNGFSATLGVMKDSITELGVAGLFTGTKARLVHVTVMVVIQLFVYDYVKTLFGIPVTGYH